MDLTVMNYSGIRDLCSSFGWPEDNSYMINSDCLAALKTLETELLKEDVVTRNVRMCLGLGRVVEKDLLPILKHTQDNKVFAATVRLLINITLPIECLQPLEESVLTAKGKTVLHQLQTFLVEAKKAFLNDESTSVIVSALRKEMMKSEKHHISLSNEDCERVKDCLFLVRNLLHCPDQSDALLLGVKSDSYFELQSLHNKLIWNLFVQGLDGALLLMFASKHKEYWTVPLVQLVALLFKDQHISKVQPLLTLLSSASESSEDDVESDTSKNSSSTLSSEPSKNSHLFSSDSGFPQMSDSYSAFHSTQNWTVTSDCQALKNVEEIEDREKYVTGVQERFESENRNKNGIDINMDNISESSLGEELTFKNGREREMHAVSTSRLISDELQISSPHDGVLDNSKNAEDKKRTKTGSFDGSKIFQQNRDSSSSGFSQGKLSSDEGNQNEIEHIPKHAKVTLKQRIVQAHMKASESDSSNDDEHHTIKVKRNHPPAGRRGKSPGGPRIPGCSPSVCMDAAINAACNNGRIKYPQWERRNSLCALLDKNSQSPSQEEIRTLLKGFTMSFLHSGFSSLTLALKKLLVNQSTVIVDNSHFFWLLSYFLHLATSLNISLHHITDIISVDVFRYLTFEGVTTCEEVELSIMSHKTVPKHLLHRLHLLVTAVKEMISTTEIYFRKSNHRKDKLFIQKLYSQLAELQDLRQLSLLLLLNYHPSIHTKQYLADLVTTNHQLLLLVEKGSSEDCYSHKKFKIVTHLRQFATLKIMNYYGIVLEDFKSNSDESRPVLSYRLLHTGKKFFACLDYRHFVNDCVFNMMHHVAGDLNSPELLFQPNILKTFSSILKEEWEHQQYWEDLIMYILNKFTQQIKRYNLKQPSCELPSSSICYSEEISNSTSRASSSSENSVTTEDDDLFWWYLQFEQDNNPVERILEHVPTSKEDILHRLLLKGIITQEKCEEFEQKIMRKKSDGESYLKSLPAENLKGKIRKKSDVESHLKSLHEENLKENIIFDDDITHLLCNLVQAGSRQHIAWLQDLMLESCYVKLGMESQMEEPVPYYSNMLKQSIPVVPYNEDQVSILKNDTFLQLLHKLGFHLATDACKLYPRIPCFWTADVLYGIATRLGPIEKDKMKFNCEELLLNCTYNSASEINAVCSDLPPLPPLSSCSTLSSWLTAVQQNKEFNRLNRRSSEVYNSNSLLLSS